MSKNFVFKFVLALVAVAAAVLWLLSVLMEETFGWLGDNHCCGRLRNYVCAEGAFFKIGRSA